MQNKETRGIFFILISAFFYATYGVWSRLMSQSFGEFSQAWTRGAFLLVVMLLINAKFHIFKPINKKDLPWFVIIALGGGLNQAPAFFGFKYLNIGTATLLFYAALVVGGYLMGKLVFKEKLTGIKIISLFLGIIGMLLIYRLTLTPDQLLATVMIILSGLMGSVSAVLPKKLSGEYAEFQIMSGYFIVMIIANGIIGFILNDPLPSLTQGTAWGAQLGYAFAMLFANWAVIEGFKHLEASIGSLIGMAEILFGIGFGVLLFGESVGIGTLIGGFIIIVSGALPNLRKSPAGLGNLS